MQRGSAWRWSVGEEFCLSIHADFEPWTHSSYNEKMPLYSDNIMQYNYLLMACMLFFLCGDSIDFPKGIGDYW